MFSIDPRPLWCRTRSLLDKDNILKALVGLQHEATRRYATGQGCPAGHRTCCIGHEPINMRALGRCIHCDIATLNSVPPRDEPSPELRPAQQAFRRTSQVAAPAFRRPPNTAESRRRSSPKKRGRESTWCALERTEASTRACSPEAAQRLHADWPKAPQDHAAKDSTSIPAGKGCRCLVRRRGVPPSANTLSPDRPTAGTLRITP